MIRIRPSSAIRSNQQLLQLRYLATRFVRIAETSPSPDVVIWRVLNRLFNKLKRKLHHIGYLAYLLQRLTWQPTIALLTIGLTYHPSIIALIVINSTRLFPARESGVDQVILTLPNVFINQTHHAQAETVLFDRGVPKLFHSTWDWLRVPPNRILAIVCLTRQSHFCNCRIQSP